jgi:uncharacterized protein (TIGR00251 family)
LAGLVRPLAKGVAFAVRVTPKAGRNAMAGTWRGADGRTYIKVRVAAPAHEGAANEATIRLIAATLGVPKGQVEIVQGASSREKRLKVTGDTATLTARLEAVAGREGAKE